MYTSGVWVVKKGREDDFARRWQESADRLALDFPGVKFMLLHDRENPQRFISLGEGWRNAAQIEAARETPGVPGRDGSDLARCWTRERSPRST